MARRHPRPPRFRRKRKNSFGLLANWWLLWRVPILALVVMAAWWFVFQPMIQEQGWVRVTDRFSMCRGDGERQPGCVVDGDTVVVGFGDAQRRIRLTGYNAPELDGACAAESELAVAASLKLQQWLNAGPFEWDGTDDAPRDQYGREVRAARRTAADGTHEYLADVMIDSGNAADSSWGSARPDWCS